MSKPERGVLRKPPVRASALIAVAALVGAILTGCAGGGSGSESEDGGKIALLLPDAKTARYETFDRPLQ